MRKEKKKKLFVNIVFERKEEFSQNTMGYDENKTNDDPVLSFNVNQENLRI